jgi:uncharacterized membrane protein
MNLNIKFTTKPNMLLLIVSVVLFIMIFLPWFTVSYLGFSASANGFHNGGILTFIMALAGVALSFLEIPTPRYRSMGIIGIGILALLGVIIAMTQLGGASMGIGMIIALIVSILLIAVGFLDLRNIDLWAKMKASSSKPPASPPPAPPAPPAQK